MSLRRIVATASRVWCQLLHDSRTLGLIFFVPCALLVLMKFVFENQRATFNEIEPLMLGTFPLTIMFLITSITTLRERTTGTLDRLMTMPIAKLDFILGYALAFTLVAAIQAALATWLVIGLLAVPVAGGALPMLIGAILGAFLGTALGLFVSAFARTEFQAVQFLPVVIIPQLMTCGLFVARDRMASWLYYFSDFMPMTYSVDAMKRVRIESSWSSTLTHDFVVVVGVAIGVLVLGAITIRRRD